MQVVSSDMVPDARARIIAERAAWLGMSIGLMQVVVTQTTAVAARGPLVTLVNEILSLVNLSDLGNGLSPVPQLLRPILVGVVSVLLCGILSLTTAVIATFEIARVTGDAPLGVQSGLRVAWLSGISWIVLSTLATVVVRTDGIFLAVDPYFTLGIFTQSLLLGVFVFIRTLLCWGISSLAMVILASLFAEAGAARFALAPRQRIARMAQSG